MSNLIPFTDNAKLPAHLKEFAAEGNEFGFSSGAAYPVISLKGKVFTINRNGEKTLVTKPGGDGEPAAALEVVILNSAPKGAKYARTFYASGFVEGANAKPDCYSNDGEGPAADAQEAQAKKCALCPQNAVGSGATAQNPKGKACRSSKLLAVAPAGQLNDPMLLRVPGDSLIKLNEYGDFLAKRGVKSAAVVTRIGFDYTVAHPKLSFKAVGFVTPEMAAEIVAQQGSDTVRAIIGEKTPAVNPLAEELGIDTAPQLEAPKPKAAAKPAPAPVVEDDDDLPKTPKQNTKVEAEPAKAAPAKKAKPPVEVAEDGDIDSALDALDFDDE